MNASRIAKKILASALIAGSLMIGSIEAQTKGQVAMQLTNLVDSFQTTSENRSDNGLAYKRGGALDLFIQTEAAFMRRNDEIEKLLAKRFIVAKKHQRLLDEKVEVLLDRVKGSLKSSNGKYEHWMGKLRSALRESEALSLREEAIQAEWKDIKLSEVVMLSRIGEMAASMHPEVSKRYTTVDQLSNVILSVINKRAAKN